MANWWDNDPVATPAQLAQAQGQPDVTSTGFGSAPMPQQAQAPAPQPVAQPPQAAPPQSRFLTPQSGQTMGGLFAGLPQEALMIAGLGGPENGMKFLAPFMSQQPIEVMGPNGPMFVSPWQARGMPSPGTLLGIRKEGREQQGQDFNQRLDLSKYSLDSANKPVTPDAQGRPTINPFASQAGAAGELEKGASDRILKSADTARAAATGIQSIYEGRKLLDQGAITGWGADFRVGFGSALKTLGVDTGDAASNTQAYGAAMANQVFGLIRNLGSGSGISDADRRFAERAAGKDFTFNEDALRKVLDIGERASRRAIELHARDAQPYLDAGTLSPGARQMLNVPAPPAYEKPPPAAAPTVTVPMPSQSPAPPLRYVPGRGIQ